MKRLSIPKKFSKIYKFHSIRKDNIVEVLKNEIEPLKDLTKMISNLMKLPDYIIRKKIRSLFLKWDMDLFQRDYERMVANGMSHSNALHALARKVLTVMWGMWKNQRSFDPQLWQSAKALG